MNNAELTPEQNDVVTAMVHAGGIRTYLKGISVSYRQRTYGDRVWFQIPVDRLCDGENAILSKMGHSCVHPFEGMKITRSDMLAFECAECGEKWEEGQ